MSVSILRKVQFIIFDTIMYHAIHVKIKPWQLNYMKKKKKQKHHIKFLLSYWYINVVKASCENLS